MVTLFSTTLILGIIFILLSFVLFTVRLIKYALLSFVVGLIILFGLSYLTALWESSLATKLFLGTVVAVVLYLMYGRKKGKKK